jgi:hypothetical protein
MDGHRFAFVWGLLYSVAGAAILLYTGDWFGISSINPSFKYLILIYFILSAAFTLFFGLGKRSAGKDELAIG